MQVDSGADRRYSYAMICIKRILIVPLVAAVLATLLAVVPTGSSDVPVLSTLQAEPADAHEYLEATGIFINECNWDLQKHQSVCRYVEKLSPKAHWHGWKNVCKLVAILVDPPVTKIVKWVLRAAKAVTVVYDRVCETVEEIIWAL